MAPSELTLEQIHRFFLDNNGVCKNRDVVSAFKPYLTDPHTKEDARNRFRQYINMLAHTKKGENDEKYLVLKSKYANSLDVSSPPSPVTPSHRDPRNSIGLPPSPYDFGSPVRGSPRQPPPYRPPPPVTPSPSHSVDNISITGSLDGTPLAPPRRRSVDKIKIERTKSMEDRDGNVENSVTDDPVTPKRGIGVLAERDTNVEEKENMSVREKTQKFNRLASCEDELSSPKTPKSAEKKKKGVDEDDSASIPMEPKKLVEWFVTASKGEYHELVKLAAADRRLVKKKDPFTAYTVLHWAAKHGNENIIKEFAGNYQLDVNAKTNGGYTPLHIAAQFGHESVYQLLKQTYGANDSIRDYSGRTPEYYKKKENPNKGNNYVRKKSRKKQSEKDLGFLRIGSLNVRVKKTTEAFSNFLGVGSGAIQPMETMNEKVHKGWGSADNVTRDNVMGAPKGYATKKKSKRPNESGMSSTPTTPKTPNKNMKHFANDSDSDTAAGFDSNWKN